MRPATLLRFGTFGPRKVSKTTSLSALYLCREGGGLALEVVDRATIDYLRPLAEGLQAGRFPEATQPKLPDRLEWFAYVEEQKYLLQCIDFGGELTDPVWRAGPEEFRDRVGAWFRECNAILLFVDCTSAEPLYLDAIDRLFAELERQPTRHGSRQRAVAVVLTMADRLPGVTPENLHAPDFVDERLAQHPLYQRLKRQLARKSETAVYRVFLSSAVGWHFASVSDPKRRVVQPCNLFEPLLWAVQEAHRIVAETHEEKLAEAERCLEALDRGQHWWLTNYKRMVEQLDRLTERFHLREGPLAARVAAKRQELLHKKARQRATLAACAAQLLLLALGGLWVYGRDQQHARFDEFERLVQEQPADHQVQARLAFYEAHIGGGDWDWFLGLQGRREQADRQAEHDRQILARREAEAALEQLQVKDAAWSQSGQQPSRHQAVLDYLARHGDYTPADRRQELAQILEATRAAWERDRRAWKEAEGLAIGHPDDYAAKIDRFKTYALRPDALQKQDGERLADALARQQRCDRAAYDQLSRLAAGTTSSEAVRQLVAQVQQYLHTREHGHAMAGGVREFQTQLERYKQSRPVYVTVKDVRVPGDFLNRTWTGNPRPSVKLHLGGVSHKTDPVDTRPDGGGFIGSVEQTVGPFTVAWDHKQTLKVEVQVHRSVFANEKASALFDDDSVLEHVNGKVKVRGVEVGLECKEARLPKLPAYGDH
jgi:hypothetical protein